MGPVIVLDKSAIQSLSHQEIEFLHRYYFVNVTPILLVEILGDLKKKFKNVLSEEKVAQLARKFLSLDSAINIHYRGLAISSLLGSDPKTDGRPVIAGRSRTVEHNGKKGIIIQEPLEKRAVRRWQDGAFSQAESILAGRWREVTTALHLNSVASFGPPFRLRDLSELEDMLSSMSSQKFNQVEVLKWLLIDFNVHYKLAQKIFYRWETGTSTLVSQFAPYAYYCFYVNLFFYLGLASGLLDKKPTNRIDLEYYYYLPFCKIFVSGDKFHKSTCQYFLKEDQVFIEGSVLKADLGKLVTHWNNLNDEGKAKWNKEWGIYPPENPESRTHQLWQIFMKPRPKGQISPGMPSLSEEQEGALARYIDSCFNAKEVGDDRGIDSDKAGFVITEKRIGTNEPCPCNSGKTFGACCVKRLNLKP